MERAQAAVAEIESAEEEQRASCAFSDPAINTNKIQSSLELLMAMAST